MKKGGELKLFADWVCHTRFISLSCLGGNWRTPGVELNIKLKLNEARVEWSRRRGPSVHTIYLQIAAAGGQQLFGRMGGANINYLKQQICVSNTFTKSPQLSILCISVKLDTKG